MIKVKNISLKSRDQFNDGLKNLENSIEYPYGDDFFKIDHGKSYFSFFDRLGTSYFNIALNGNNLIACGCGIIRSLPNGDGFKSAWYLCDLKVHQNFRGQKLPKKLFSKNLIFNYLKCSRGYTISMNPPSSKNRVLNIIENLPFFPLKFATNLNFFEISKDEVISVNKDINNIIGETVQFLSLGGVKDIVLNSTGKPMPLFHAQYGPMASPKSKKIESDGRYMFCTPENSKLCTFLKSHFPVSATASVLQHRLNNQNWDFILSSDI